MRDRDDDDVPQLIKDRHPTKSLAQRRADRNLDWNKDIPKAYEGDRPAVGRRSDGLNRGVFS